MKILAGIVLFNPDINRLKENIKNIEKQVDKIILIDNASQNINEVEKEFNNIEIKKNNKNLGIANALNQILEYATKNKYQWFITLDQDSVCNNQLIEKYINNISLEENKDVAMYTCNIVDRNFETNNSNQGKFVDRCITSGTLSNTEKLNSVGGFDIKMFIDLVDFDICTTLIENGYKIKKIGYNGLLHEVGHARKIKILKKSEVIYNHTAFRVYYIIRNSIYYAYKHKIKKFYLLTVKRALLILIFQKNKKENLKNIMKGTKDGLKMIKEMKHENQKKNK